MVAYDFVLKECVQTSDPKKVNSAHEVRHRCMPSINMPNYDIRWTYLGFPRSPTTVVHRQSHDLPFDQLLFSSHKKKQLDTASRGRRLGHPDIVK